MIVSVCMNEDVGELQGDTTDCSYFEFKNCRNIQARKFQSSLTTVISFKIVVLEFQSINY